jgi:hypothetical protein
MLRRSIALAAASAVTAAALPAAAIPSFTRTYGTSCTTCHTVYPKLTPFGEAFRRDGFRFPGTDSDYVKQNTVTLQAKTATSGPAWLTAIPPLSVGFNGQAVLHPDKNSSGALADHQAFANLSGLVSEGHIWAGGTLTDTVSYFGEVVISPDGAAAEQAEVFFNDLVGPAHAVNVRIGRGASTLSSFGPHSSFLADALLPPTGLVALNGASSGAFNVGDNFNGVEVSGVVVGVVDYSVGWNAGSSFDVRSAEDVYGHVGVKLGGMRLDGEGKSVANPERPWEETAITFDVFGYHSYGSVQFGDQVLLNTVNTLGGGVRAQWGSLELNSGVMFEQHKHAEPGYTGASLLTQYNELSYIVVPWLVPAIRFEYSSVSPDSACAFVDESGASASCPSVTDWRLWPGVALLPYPNVKVVITAMFERASGAPLGGSWGPAGGMGPAPSGSGTEFQNVQILTAFAF